MGTPGRWSGVICGALLALILLPGTARAESTRWVHDLSFDSRGRLIVAVLGGPRLEVVRLNANGEPDPSFGTNGLLRPRFSGGGAQVVVQKDDRILVGGRAGKRTFMRRFLPSGKPDRSFGAHGKVRLPVYAVKRLMVQPDGHIVVLSTVSCSAERCGYAFTRLVILRYTRGGQLASAQLQYSERWSMSAADMGPKGRFVVAGGDWELEFSTLARFMPGGRFDPSLGGKGGLTIDNEDLEEAPALTGRALTVQSDEKIVFATGYGPSELVRRNRDGSVDLGFGNGGVVQCGTRPPFGAPNPLFSAVEALAGNSLLAAGGNAECGLVRYLADGTPDPAFGVGGTVDVEAAGMTHPQAMAVRAGIGIALAGWDASARTIRVARYTDGGGLDPAFGAGGIVSLTAP